MSKTVAKLGDGIAEGEEVFEQDGAREMEGVSRAIEVTIESCGLLASERERDGGEIEAGDLLGRTRAALVGRGSSSRRYGAEQESAQRNGFCSEGGELQGFVGELKFAGEGWLLRDWLLANM